MTPIGGGGLTSGAALTLHYLSPATEMVAVEPAGADDAFQSFHSGRLIPAESPNTIADGLLTSLGDKTFPIVKELVDDIVTVDDESIIVCHRK